MMVERGASAQMLSEAEPESVGMSTERLGRLTDFLSEEVETGRLPGAIAMIARKGRMIYSQAVGYRDEATRDPMPIDALFQVYSMTKPMVSVGSAAPSISDDVSQIPVHDDHASGDPQYSWDDYIEA